MAEVSSGSFDSYEGIRIILPGAIVSAVGFLVLATVTPRPTGTLSDNAVLWIITSLAIGLSLYYLDFPAKSAAFSELQPTDYLEERYKNFKKGEVLTLYLLILNMSMPANTRNRALYMGSMYRIGYELILSLAFGSGIVLVFSRYPYGALGPNTPDTHAYASAGIIFICYIFGLLLSRSGRKRSQRRSATSGTPPHPTSPPNTKDRTGVIGWARNILRLVAHQFKLLRTKGRRGPTVFWIIGLMVLCAPQLPWINLTTLVAASFEGTGLALCIAAWASLYTLGVGERTERKREVPGLVGFGYLIPCVGAILLPTGQSSALSTTSTQYGWSLAIGLALVLMMSGGHERKLHGVYRGQKRWLTDNSGLVDRFFRANEFQEPTQGCTENSSPSPAVTQPEAEGA